MKVIDYVKLVSSSSLAGIAAAALLVSWVIPQYISRGYFYGLLVGGAAVLLVSAFFLWRRRGEEIEYRHGVFQLS